MLGHQLGSQLSSKDNIGVARLKLMNMLSKISYWVNYVSSCGRNRTKTSDIRKTITFGDSIRVTLVSILPQSFDIEKINLKRVILLNVIHLQV